MSFNRIKSLAIAACLIFAFTACTKTNPSPEKSVNGATPSEAKTVIASPTPAVATPSPSANESEGAMAVSPTPAAETTPSSAAEAPAPAADSAALTPIIVLKKDCSATGVSELMVRIQNGGGKLNQVLFQQGAFTALVPETLLAEIKAEPGFGVLSKATERLADLSLQPACQANVQGIVSAWMKNLK